MEVAIIAKAKQGYIYRHMIENGLTAVELAKRIGLSLNQMGAVINFKWLPTNKNRKGGVAEKLEQYFKVPIEMLFPPELTKEIAIRLHKKYIEFKEIETVSLECTDQRLLGYDPQGDDKFAAMADNIPHILCTLTPREEQCLRLRYGIGGEGADRVNSAIDIFTPMIKLRNPSRRKMLTPMRKVA